RAADTGASVESARRVAGTAKALDMESRSIPRYHSSKRRSGPTRRNQGAAVVTVPRVDDPAVFIDAHYDLHPLLRMYLLALVSARMGDFERATQYAGKIGQQRFPTGYEGLAADLARSVGAQIDRVQRKPADALEKLEPILADTKNPLESPFVSEAYERFTRAEL